MLCECLAARCCLQTKNHCRVIKAHKNLYACVDNNFFASLLRVSERILHRQRDCCECVHFACSAHNMFASDILAGAWLNTEIQSVMELVLHLSLYFHAHDNEL